jgi:prolipoprotein diacylglyceryltransferase
MIHLALLLYHLAYGALIGFCLWATFYCRHKQRGIK